MVVAYRLKSVIRVRAATVFEKQNARLRNKLKRYESFDIDDPDIYISSQL